MLPELGSRLSNNQFIKTSDNASPYLLQFKVFEERLRRQEKQTKPSSHSVKARKQDKSLKEDYLEITRSILCKKENFNLFVGLPNESEQSVELIKGNEEITAKTRELFEKNIQNKKNVNKSCQYEPLRELRENSTCYQNSRILSEAHTHIVRNKAKSSDISFIGYKRGRKCIDNGFKKIWGLI